MNPIWLMDNGKMKDRLKDMYSGPWLLRPPKRLVPSGLNSKVVGLNRLFINE